MTTTTVAFETSAGLVLEGRLAVPQDRPRGVAILCHPYPPAGGSMSNAMLPSLQRALEEAGWAALRFNFRGVGRSEGSFDHGRGEVDDAAAALAFAREHIPGVPCAVVGWSFGALVGLNAARADTTVAAYIGIAPPVSAAPELELPTVGAARVAMRSLVICGTADRFCETSDVRRLAADIGAEVRILDGADHFFVGRLAELGAIVTEFLIRDA